MTEQSTTMLEECQDSHSFLNHNNLMYLEGNPIFSCRLLCIKMPIKTKIKESNNELEPTRTSSTCFLHS